MGRYDDSLVTFALPEITDSQEQAPRDSVAVLTSGLYGRIMKNAPCHRDCGERRPSVTSTPEELLKLKQISLTLQEESRVYDYNMPVDNWVFYFSLQK